MCPASARTSRYSASLGSALTLGMGGRGRDPLPWPGPKGRWLAARPVPWHPTTSGLSSAGQQHLSDPTHSSPAPLQSRGGSHSWAVQSTGGGTHCPVPSCQARQKPSAALRVFGLHGPHTPGRGTSSNWPSHPRRAGTGPARAAFTPTGPAPQAPTVLGARLAAVGPKTGLGTLICAAPLSHKTMSLVA